MDDVIKTKTVGGVFEVTLDRPKANAIDLPTSRKMGDTFAHFRDNDALRVCIVRTAGEKFFSAGWDLKAAAAGDSVTADYGVGGFAGLQELRGLNKPVIAAVEGMCVGGGLRTCAVLRHGFGNREQHLCSTRNSRWNAGRCRYNQAT